jgi:ribosomal protein S18 acetylase RimI-like enzyme
MNNILTDLSVPVLVAAVKANMFAWFRYLGKSPKAELFESPKLTWFLTSRPTSFANGVLYSQLEPDKVDETIEKTRAYFESKNVSTFSWWVEQGTQPPNLGDHLIARGFKHVAGSPGMAIDLFAMNEDSVSPPGLMIERVSDREMLKQWAYVSTVSYGLPESSVNSWFAIFDELGLELPLRNYVGILNGKVVATSQLFLAAGVAGIYLVGTMPEARRQGVGAALTRAPMQEARAMGYRVGTLGSSPKGLGVYRQLGFQEYCKLSHYIWDGGKVS